jgi:enoyl-CoA hydratase/carnithine racemase
METVLKRQDEHVGIITLNRPNSNNTFNEDLAKNLNKYLDEFESDDNIRVVLINANGRNFCTGIDLTEYKGKSYREYHNWVKLMEDMSVTIEDMKKPVIAAVQGYAVANGIGLVASSDIAIGTDSSKYGATAVNVGLFCIGPAVPLSRVIGRRKAMELLLTGDIMSANEALTCGLINKVVKEEELENASLEMAKKIASKSPIAVQIGKEAFNTTENLPYKEALELSHHYFAMLCSTEDAAEGVDAFLNKRNPTWKLK